MLRMGSSNAKKYKNNHLYFFQKSTNKKIDQAYTYYLNLVEAKTRHQKLRLT